MLRHGQKRSVDGWGICWWQQGDETGVGDETMSVLACWVIDSPKLT